MRIDRKSRIGIGGVLISIVAILLAMGAVNSGNNLLVAVFGIVIGAIIVSGVVSGSMLMGVRVERHAPARMRVGEPAFIEYDIRNAARFSHAFALLAGEAGPDALRAFGPAAAFVAHIPPKSDRRTRLRVVPRARGVVRLEGVRVASRFPVGFMEKTIIARSPAQIIIHPRVATLRADPFAELSGRALDSSTTLPRSGRGEEFFGVRDYSPGDPMRHIAWRATARTGALIVRQHTEPRSRALWILLDDTAPDEDAVTLAASIAWQACERGMVVGLASATRGTLVAPGRGARHRTLVLDALASIDFDHEKTAPRQWRPPGASRAACIAVHAQDGAYTGAPHSATHFPAGSLRRMERPEGLTADTEADR